MKTVSSILIGLGLIYVFADISIKFKPFKVSLNNPFYLLGSVIMAVGITVMVQTERKRAYKKGFDDCTEAVEHLIEQYKEQAPAK